MEHGEMTQRRKGRERERDGFLGDLGRARAEKRRERASNLLAPSVGLGRPLLLVRSPSLSRPFSISAPLSKSEREREKKESGVVNDCENPSSVGNLLRKLFKALARSLDPRLEMTRVKMLPRYNMLHANRQTGNYTVGRPISCDVSLCFLSEVQVTNRAAQ